jgi:hypothetical protein
MSKQLRRSCQAVALCVAGRLLRRIELRGSVSNDAPDLRDSRNNIDIRILPLLFLSRAGYAGSKNKNKQKWKRQSFEKD